MMASKNPSTSLASQEVDLRATFKLHKSSLKTFLELNDVQDEEKKKGIFLLSLRKELEELLQRLCTQDELEEMSCAELLTRLERVLRSDDLLLQYTAADKHQEPTPSGSQDVSSAPVVDLSQTVSNSTFGFMAQNSSIKIDSITVSNTIQKRGQTAKDPLPYKLRNKLSTFRGREEYLQDLATTFDNPDCNVVVVHGMSGVGKSELVIQYAHNNRHCYQNNIIWVHAEHLQEEFFALAGELDIYTRNKDSDSRPMIQVIRDVYSWLREKGVCLLVLDDVLTRDMITEFLPSDQYEDIRVLITSPYAYWRGVHTIKLLPLTDSESKDILAAALGNKFDLDTQKDDLEYLLAIVNGYPLAVQICASYISYECRHKRNFALSTYINKLEANLLTLNLEETFFKHSEHTCNKTIYTALVTTLQKIEKIITKSKLSDTLQVLNVCAYLNAEAIQRSLLSKICKSNELDEAIDILVDFSLVQNDNDEQVRMHKMIQEAIILNQQKLHEEFNWYQKVLEYFLDNSECPDSHTTRVFSHSQNHNQLMYDLYKKKFCRSKLLTYLVSHDCYSVLRHIFEQVKNERKLKKLVRDNDLMRVAVRNHCRVAEHLVMYADLNKRYKDEFHRGSTLLHLTARHGHADLCQLLLDGKCSVKVRTYNGRYAIHVAAEHGHQEVVEVLVKKNPVSVNWTDWDKHDPVHLAARRGHVNVLRCLLEVGGAAVDTTNSRNGRTALMLAAEKGQTEAVRCLLDHCASIQASDLSQWSALHHASRYGHADIAALLLAAPGCEVNALDKDGWSPLHMAAWWGHLDVVRVLCAAGARGDVLDHEVYTPLGRASQRGHTEVRAFLKEQFPGVKERRA